MECFLGKTSGLQHTCHVSPTLVWPAIRISRDKARIHPASSETGQSQSLPEIKEARARTRIHTQELTRHRYDAEAQPRPLQVPFETTQSAMSALLPSQRRVTLELHGSACRVRA